ncbi:protein disabled [Elysia marginata]|uniref:Protein disabled n=1 Tax=Elysia marginata TaxID=1093978 RepID=A0AAV4G7A3_9GAST|nr:protein disabled [Elysia marginata]
MSTKAKKDEVDVSRFEGNGLSFKAKLIGVEDVPEARGDQMCQDALLKLKNSVRVSGEHKQKIFVNVTLEGLKIVDAISLGEKQNKKKNDPKSPKPGEDNADSAQEADGSVLHSHAVHRISFISRDTTDSRAFGYIYGETDDTHKFYAIKTAAAAEQLVYTIRDLFQAVYDMKKKEMEDAKQKLEQGDITANITSPSEEGNSQTPGNGSTSGTGQTPLTSPNAEGENIYQVPPNNAPVQPQPQAEQVANLLDLEDQTEHILKGIEQIKNLEFDSIAEDPKSPTSPVSPTSPLVSMAGPGAPFADPWGMPAASNTPAAPTSSSSSALGDLAGLQTSTFPSMPGGMQPGGMQPGGMQPGGMQPFPGTAFPGQAGGFGAAPGFGPSGLPVTTDPFANDPFSMNAQQRPAVPPAGGFPASNPFGGGGGGFPPQQLYGAPPRGMMPGAPGVPGVPGAAGAPGFMGQPGFGQPAAVGMAPNPFGMGFGQVPAAPQQANFFGEAKEDSNLLQPMRKDDGSTQREDAADKAPKKLRDDPFGDLLDIKKTPGSSSDSPKDLFAKANKVEKKSMNALKAQVGNTSLFDSEPFGSSHSPDGDKTRGLLPSHSEDPFDTSHIPPTLSEPPKSSPPAQPICVADNTPPPVPKRPVIPVAKEANKPTLSPPVLLPPPHPSPRSSKLSHSSFSSSSSISSTSSSPSLSSKSQHQPPSAKPPPLPKRTPADGASPSKTCDIDDVNTPSLNLALSTGLSAQNSDMLPSPDEPPPPLPNISYAASAPPPPPRPSSSFPASTRQFDLSGRSDKPSNSALLPSQAAAEKDFEVKFDDDDLFSSALESLNNATKTDKRAELLFSKDMSSESDKTSTLQREPENLSPKAAPRDPADPFSPSLSLLKSKSRPRAVLSPRKQAADPFSIPPPSGKTKTQVTISKTDEAPTATGAVDPFTMPVHLTPGFKAEAKFGNDPFDDSFTEVLHGKQAENSWDPFSPSLNTSDRVNSSNSKSPAASVSSDPFGAPAQPVNGNTSANQGSLFD